TTTTTTTETTADLNIPSTYGDVNYDGHVTLLDVIYLNKFIAGSVQLSESQISNVDACYDGVVNSSDVSVLLKYTVEAITSIPLIP
ncbi:MAG: dockerin type I repeat-containing protein, partial [Oscillospiraceae bacterium]|nr:dockerin type I repeat-containing protein [Oscillospiraceae bacterium]